MQPERNNQDCMRHASGTQIPAYLLSMYMNRNASSFRQPGLVSISSGFALAGTASFANFRNRYYSTIRMRLHRPIQPAGNAAATAGAR